MSKLDWTKTRKTADDEPASPREPRQRIRVSKTAIDHSPHKRLRRDLAMLTADPDMPKALRAEIKNLLLGRPSSEQLRQEAGRCRFMLSSVKNTA